MLKDLLHIVREQLLVVDLPPTRGSALADGSGEGGLVPAFVEGRTKCRATACEIRKALDAIKKRDKDAEYVHTGCDLSDVGLPAVRIQAFSTHWRSTIPAISDAQTARSAQ